MTITMDEVIQILKNDIELSKMNVLFCHNNEYGIGALQMAVETLEQTRWIPVKWHEITDEEREREDYPKEWTCHLDCIMPYDGQRILITTKGGFVELDECYSDDGYTFSLDSGYDWVDDVVAWMPLPEPARLEDDTDAKR